MALLVIIFVFINVSDLQSADNGEENVTEAPEQGEYGVVTETIIGTKKALGTMVEGWNGIMDMLG